MGLGTTELLLILAVVFLVFGGSRLPGLGKALGESMRNFRTGLRDTKTPNREIEDSDDKPSPDVK